MISAHGFRRDVPHVALRELVEFLDSQRKPITERDRKAGPYPYYGANGVQGYVDGFLFDEPLVLLAEDGGHFDDPDRGIAFKISGKTWVNNHAHVLRPSSVVDIDYLVRVLEHLDVTPYINGSTRAKLTKGNAESIEVPLPPLPEQKRIAAILEKAGEVQRKQELAMAKLEQLAQSVFLEMFGDVGTNPKQLRVAKLQELCNRITDGTHQSPEWTQRGVPFLFISNIVNGQIVFDTEKYISTDTYAELTRRCPIELGDILYTTVGSYGNAAIVATNKPFAFQRHIAHIKPNPSRVDPTFLSAMIQSPGVRRQVDQVARGVAQKTVNLGDLKALDVFDIPLSSQRSFSNAIERVTDVRARCCRAADLTESLQQSLAHTAFGVAAA